MKNELDIEASFDEYANTPTGWAQRWGAEFAYAKEFCRKWQTSGKKTVAAWLMRDQNTNDITGPNYNMGLFWANVKTQTDMLYGRVPQVSVDRRWADPNDQVARVAGEMATRLLNADMEEAGEDFSTILRNCLQDRLIPGLGVVRVRYDLEEGESPTGEGAEPPLSDSEGAAEQKEATSRKIDEWLEDIYVPWNDIMWSPARFWKEIRWIAFRTYKDKNELKRMLGDKVDLKHIPFNSKNPMEQLSSKTSNVWNKAEVWEIWSKEFGYVFWYIDGYNEILDSKEDPLELEGFFPCPPFFIANVTTSEYAPKSDYSFAESLYREIDILSERISLLTKAVKVVGVYDKKAGPDVARLVNETAENKLIPVDSWAVFQERGGIKGSLEFLPIDQIVEAIGQLQDQKQARISELYQITGMSDIIRGEASDEQQVGTQQLKAKFASIRIQAIQDEFTRFATDHQRIRLEIICRFFDIPRMIARSNMGMTFDAQMAMQAAQFLKDSISKGEVSRWRIMIAPESMAMVDYAQIRMERTEYINSLGIFLQSAFPIAEKFPAAAPILMELLKWGLAGFKGSKQIEGVIDQAMSQLAKQTQAGAGQQGDPKAQAELAKMRMEMQQSQADHQNKMQENNQKHQMKMMEMMTAFKAEMAEIMGRIQESKHKAQHSILESALSQGPAVPEQPAGPLSLGQPPTPTPAQPAVPGGPNGLAP